MVTSGQVPVHWQHGMLWERQGLKAEAGQLEQKILGSQKPREWSITVLDKVYIYLNYLGTLLKKWILIQLVEWVLRFWTLYFKQALR